MKKIEAPLIGVTLDVEPPGGFAQHPWYALRAHYAEAVAAAGGLPVLLPHGLDQVEAYLDRLDALVISGGAFDVDPGLYAGGPTHETVHTKAGRTAFEWALIEGALARQMPCLGVCGGMQLLNVVLGGTLIQHIPEARPEALQHEQEAPRDQPGHGLEVVPGTLLARSLSGALTAVNSSHHQAVDQVAPGVVVSAVAPDGIIEAIEVPAQRFCLGVQWHPEYRNDSAEVGLFEGLIEAARADQRR